MKKLQSYCEEATNPEDLWERLDEFFNTGAVEEIISVNYSTALMNDGGISYSALVVYWTSEEEKKTP